MGHGAKSPLAGAEQLPLFVQLCAVLLTGSMYMNGQDLALVRGVMGISRKANSCLKDDRRAMARWSKTVLYSGVQVQRPHASAVIFWGTVTFCRAY